MPRPAKGKRGKGAGAVGGHDAADLLERLNSSGLGEKEVLAIVGANKVPCEHLRSPCVRNRKENVACFCQLVPAETSYRKKGLWQKEQTYLGTLGSDPKERQREDAATPAGLRNLGNTCYANAALQCLFSIPSLRTGIYTAEPAVAGHDILRQLQGLFLQMQFGPQRSVDTEALAKTLGLNHAVQQDGQEFLKLLLTRVEQLMSKSSDGAARRLVPQLFRGGLSYVTTCQRCGRDSSSSHEVQDFYDLMPQVRGFGSLTTSLASFLHAESLSGDNRYLCDFCGTKVDALRRVRLRALPPYLCLALQRFYFDPRTFDKAKALDKFAFPLTLDFSQVLAEAAAAEQAAAGAAAAAVAASTADAAGAASDAVPNADAAAPKAADAAAAAAAAVSLETPSYPVEGSPLYELVGILIHKGSQAHSGHYVAHIKDQASGQWWRFDDEVAACIGPDPAAAFQSDHGAVGAAAAAAAAAGGTAADGSTKGAGASRKRTATHDDVDYEEEAAAAGEEPGRGGGGEEEEEDDEEDGGAGGKRSGRGGRGGKKRARAGSRAGRGGSSGGGRGGKKGTAAAAAGVSAESGAGKSRGRGGQGRRGGRRGRTSGAVDMDGDASDADGELRAALAASMALQQEDEGLRFAMEASMADAAGLGVGGVGGGDTGAAAGEAGGAHAGDAEEAALVQMALEESEREAEMAAVLAGAGGAGRGGGGGGGAAGGGGGGGDAAELGEDGAGQQGDATSPMESDAEAVAAAMAASLADAAAPTPPRLTPPPSLMSAPPLRPSHLRPLALKSDEAGDDLKGSVHNSPKSGPAAAAAIKGETIGKAGGVGGSGSLVSANAYMLVYRAVGLQEPPPARTVEELPAALQAAVAEVAAAYADECDVYQRQRDALKTQVEERRRSVRELLSCISPRLPLQTSSQQPLQQQQPEVIGDDEDSADASAPQEQQQQQPGTAGYWVSMPWLEQWANDEGAPPPIDNGPITCAIHSRAGARGGAAAGAAGGAGDSQSQGGGGGAGTGSCLDPAKVAAAKLVSAEAWERLHAAHGGGPVLAAGDVCRQCLEGSASQALLGNQAEEVRRRVAALLEAGPAAGAEAEWEEAEVEEAMDAEEDASPRSFWVSRLWLQGWSKRQGASVKAEKSPTADLACPHGELQPARAAKRVAVPADIWRFLRDLWRRQRLAEAQDAAAGKPAPVGRGRGHKASSADAGGVNGSAGAGVGAGAGSPSPPAVDCMDLTGDDAPGLAASGKAGKRETVEIDQDDRVIGDDDDDEDDMQMIDAPSAQAGGAPAGAAPEAAGAGGLREDEDGSANRRSREASAVPPSREGTADVEAPVPPSELGAAADAAAGKPAATAAAAAAPARIPTAAELEAMCPELPVGRVFECELCREAAGQAASAHADSRRQLDMERNALSGLKMEAWPQLTPGCQYYMVPTSWVREWQQYVRVLPKGTPAAPRPSSLSAAMLRVLCPCHPDEPRLGVPPPRLTVSKRSRLSQLDLEQDPMRLITQEDWDHLRHVYLRDLNNASSAAAADAYAVAGTSTGTVGGRDVGGGKRRAFQRASAAIANGAHGAEDGDAGAGYAVGSNGNGRALLQEDGAADVVVKDGADGSSGAAANAAQLAAVAHGFTADVAQLVEEQQDTGAAATVSASAATGRIGGGSSRRRGDGGEAAGAVRAPDVLVWPPVCWAALAEQGRAAREAALVYSEAEVMVELVAAEDLEGAFKDSGVGLERRSRRTRKGRTSITVSNTTTLEQLKLQIFESLSIHPKNQTLYVRGDDGSPRQLQGDELSLAQHEVLPGAELRLVRLRLVDDDDDVAGLFGEGRAKRRQVEEGFKNTALHGDLPLQQQEAAAGAEQGADQGSSGAAGVQEAVEDDSHVV